MTETVVHMTGTDGTETQYTWHGNRDQAGAALRHFVAYGTIDMSQIRRPEPGTYDEAFARAYSELDIENGLGVHGHLERSMARMGWDYNNKCRMKPVKVDWAKEGF